MKLFNLVYLLILAIFATAYFTPQQLEILDLHYRIQPKDSKKLRTFYSILDIKSNANENQLENAYKKMSRKLHPDKFIKKDLKERKKAERKFETLSLIITILRDINRRKNYDYFIKNGFPIWDESKSKYLFKNRSKPNFLITILVILILSSIGQILILKLNKFQKNKRISQILRDVKWKADNMNLSSQNNNNNKILELPDDFELNSSNYSNNLIDDKLVTYCEKVFIVKPDRTVLLYNDESFDINDENKMNELIKKIIDSGYFNLYGFEKKKDLNRKERRELDKQNRKDSINNDLNNNEIIEKLVQFKEDNSGLKFSDWFIIKFLFIIWNSTFGKFFINKENINEENINEENINEENINEENINDENIIIDSKPEIVKPFEGKITLSNGKVLHSRKK